MGVLTKPRLAFAKWLQQAGAALQASSYRAGTAGGQWSGDWVLGSASMTRILQSDLPVLREKCRDVAMNTGVGAAIVGLFSENVSGKDGILYGAAVRNAAGQLDVAANTALERGWYAWAEDASAVTVDGRLTWQEVEQLTDESEVTDGETLIRLIPGFRNPWGFAVQLIDPDQLDLGYTQEGGNGRNAIIMGVEVDEWGRPVAYHLWPNHPQDVRARGQRMRVPASLMLHNFLTRRVGQMRGVPWLAPVVSDIMHLGKYREAEVVAARVAAAKMGFIKGGDGAGKSEFLDANPGALVKLGVDEEFVDWNPNHPNGNHAAFERVVLHSIAAAARVSYMSMSGDLSQTNFASGQMGYMQERNVYRKLQARRVLRYSRPVFRAWLERAVVSSRFDAPRGYSLEQLAAATWRARPFQPVDALKQARTDAINVALGKVSLTELVEADGGDLRETLERRAAEITMARELGVPLWLPIGAATAGDTDTTDTANASAPASASAASLNLRVA